MPSPTISSSVSIRDRMRKRTPSGASRENPPPRPGHAERDVDHHGAVQGAVREDAVQGRGLVYGPGEAVQHEAAAAHVGRGTPAGCEGG